MVYADLHLGAFDGSSLIGRTYLTNNAYSSSLTSQGKDQSAAEATRSIRLTLKILLGAIVDRRRGLTRGILMQSALRKKGNRCENSTTLGSFPMTAVTGP